VLNVAITIMGKAIPQGSHIAIRRGARSVIIDQQNMKTKTLPPNRLNAWRESIAQGFELELEKRNVVGAHEYVGAVKIVIIVELMRPKKSSLTSPRPDLDKLVRAVGDALSGIAYRDDRQICDIRASKRWSHRDCTFISVKHCNISDLEDPIGFYNDEKQ